jgi:hypothetical protein
VTPTASMAQANTIRIVPLPIIMTPSKVHRRPQALEPPTILLQNCHARRRRIELPLFDERQDSPDLGVPY